MLFGVRLPINDKIVYYVLLISVQMQKPRLIPKSTLSVLLLIITHESNHHRFTMNNRIEMKK